MDIAAWDRNKRNNNCYAFAFGDLRVDSPAKLQPGQLSGNTPLSDKTYTCAGLASLVLADHPRARRIPDSQRECPPGHHRVALFLDNEGANRDYHFYRELSPGRWAHKPGSLAVSTVDDSGAPIHDPRTADRDYVNAGDERKAYNYAEYCGMFCAPDKPEPLLGGGAAVGDLLAALAAVVVMTVVLCVVLLRWAK